MPDKRRLKIRLQEAASLCSDGYFDEARTLLDSLQSDPDIHVLGQYTSLGLPRQLQAARLKLAKAENDALSSAGFQYHLVPPPELLKAYVQFSHQERKAITEANRQTVPRIIHQIWIGKRALPEGVNAWIKHAQLHDYEHHLWREKDLQRLGIDQHPAYITMADKGDLPGAVDVARYIILQAMGGIYLDCDWYPARNDISFDDLLPMTGLIAMAEDKPRNTGKGGLLLANSLIAAPTQHPVFARLNSILEDVLTELPDAPAWWSTGPLIFTLVSRGGALTLADAAIVAGSLPQDTSPEDVKAWCSRSMEQDGGLLLSWKSWIW